MAISGSLLTSGGDTTATDTYTTASITPTGDALVLALVGLGDLTNETPSLTGNGLTWVLVGKVELYANGRSIYLFRAMGSSPSSGAVTISFGGLKASCTWVISEFTGVDTSGTNGSGAVEQFATDSGSSQNASVTLAAFADAGNATFGAFGSDVDANVWTAGTGFTKLGEARIGAVAINVMEQWRSDNDTTVTADLDQSRPWGGIAVEIAAEPPPPVLTRDLTINSVDRDYSQGSIRISDRIGERSVGSAIVRDPDGSLDFTEDEPVVFSSTNGRVFGGFIATASEQERTPGGMLFHNLRFKDNHFLADKRIVAKSYENQTAGQIVEDLRTTYLSTEGVTAGTISTGGAALTRIVFQDVTVADAIDRMADLADNWWRIDHDAALHFTTKGANTSTWVASSSDFFRDSVTSERDNPLYRTKQYVVGGQAETAEQSEVQEGDDNKRAFAMNYPLASKPTIEVATGGSTNWVSSTSIGLKKEETGFAWLWSKNDAVITQSSTASPLPSSDRMRVTYKGLFPVRVVASDNAQITSQKATDGTSGLIEAVERVTQASNLAESQETASALLARWASKGRRFRGATRNPQAANLNPGDLLTINFGAHDFVNDEILVEEIEVTERADDKLVYRITGVEGPNKGSWEKFFKARRRDQVDLENVDENTVLATEETFTPKVKVSVSMTPVVTACNFPSTSRFPSSTQFPC